MCCAAQFSIRSFPIPCANGALPSFTSQPLSAGCSVPPLSAYSARPGISCDARHGVGGRRCAIFAGAQRVHVHYVAAHSDTPGSAFLRLSGAAGFTPATRQSKTASLISTGTPTTGIKKPAPKGRQPRVGPRSTRTDVCAPCQRVRFAVSRLAQLRPGFGLERVLMRVPPCGRLDARREALRSSPALPGIVCLLAPQQIPTRKWFEAKHPGAARPLPAIRSVQ